MKFMTRVFQTQQMLYLIALISQIQLQIYHIINSVIKEFLNQDQLQRISKFCQNQSQILGQNNFFQFNKSKNYLIQFLIKHNDKKLKYLLSLNKITANGSHDLWACLKICKHLRNLTINLKAKGANCAHGLNSDIINTNIMILKLDLRWNKIGKNGLKSLKQALKSCVNLASLELYLSKLNLNANEVVKVTRLVPKLNKLVFKQIIID
ncbi:hypothetical protein TTHERM_00835410 (macronuclear) [Tetrahymena thermophila SB210]|uniref:Uncharacterized protein n=1 Tax=Tetrahymena thermophila (strain SB210) TaxID=312017 RepID=Q22E87_TETTS|nr:hypothetical protein TTHERM_00835410 [Tetrahymena thermophila SB210]EAR83641.3 hypothetical protein TTHERM_00835410 [Tetrahymena thermophila SB210]|eukprot:XP_001031304.3 hypothetical protein TTHERM_00835410 [Tetrahymena thermophila SB210]